MLVYKGTDKYMKCRGFQYKLGEKAVAEGTIDVCHNGLHACTSPLDVLRYYPINQGNRYFAADADGTIIAQSNGDSKIASSELTLTGEIGIRGLIKAHFEYVRKKASDSGKSGGDGSNLAGGDDSNLAGGYRSNLAGGDRSNLAGGDGSNLAGGDDSNLAGGYRSNLAGGDRSNLAGGDGSNLAGGDGSNLAGGYRSNLAGGDDSNLAGGNGSNLAGGDGSNLAGGNGSNLAGGNRSNLAGGDRSNLAGGNGSMIVGRNGCKVKGGKNSVLVLTEWGWVNEEYVPIAVVSGIVDGVKLKADTWYKLLDGEFVEDEANE